MTGTLMFIGMTVGSMVGGYIPSFFGAGIFSYWGIIGSGVGAILGVYIGYIQIIKFLK